MQKRCWLEKRFQLTSIKHGQVTLANEIYHRLALNIDQLAEAALFTPVHKITFFLNVAKEHKQSVFLAEFWGSLATNASQLAPRLTESRPTFIMSFAVQIPSQSVDEGIFRPLKIEHWEAGEFRSARFSTGAPGLALTFGRYGRNDLQNALLSFAIQRKNPADFEFVRAV
jgi:hypothetical protein